MLFEQYCHLVVLSLGVILTIIASLSLMSVTPIMVRADENARFSFILLLVGTALAAVSFL